jgi:energy-coupling factor transport system ATP-binding protein
MSIKVEELYHTYMKGTPYEKKALSNVNLTINSGEFMGLIGPTGSGKSTLIQHFNGLLKPTSGKVIVNGLDVMGKNLKELRKHVGIVFQYPEHQLFEETVYRDIAFGLVKSNCEKRKIKELVYEALTNVGLSEEIINKSQFELSGGQKRRVAIAGVLVMKPDILILDEPAAGLDPQGREGLYKLIRQMYKRNKITVVLVSHSMEDIAKITERVVVINNGKIEMDGPPGVIFTDGDKLESIGLSLPAISYLFESIKDYLPGMKECIFTVEDAKRVLRKYLKKGEKCL